MNMDNVFFDNGFLTSTEAQNICNVAKEAVTTEHEQLQAVAFYNTEIASIVAPEAFIQAKISASDISWITTSLDKIGRYNALNAWLKEAIKAKDAAINAVDTIDVTTLDCWVDYKKPEEPYEPSLYYTDADIISTWDIKKRSRYYALNSRAAAIGSYIHNEGSIAKARKDLLNKLANPSSISGSGRETIVAKYVPSVNALRVEEMYMNLLAEHRKLNAELNSLKAEIKETINKKALADAEAYRKAHLEWEEQISDFYSKVKQRDLKINEYKISEKERLSKLKINVPESLMKTYKEVKSLISE